VFTHIEVVDHFLALPSTETADYRLTDMEWSVLEDFEVILEDVLH